jgi:hypothetical protein
MSINNHLLMREIVLDTETTGLDPTEGHRVAAGRQSQHCRGRWRNDWAGAFVTASHQGARPASAAEQSALQESNKLTSKNGPAFAPAPLSPHLINRVA